jgi:hypothetical protein
VLSESYGPINSWFISDFLSDLAVEFVPSGGRGAVKFLTRLQIEETQKTGVVSSQVCVCVPRVISGHVPVGTYHRCCSRDARGSKLSEKDGKLDRQHALANNTVGIQNTLTNNTVGQAAHTYK